MKLARSIPALAAALCVVSLTACDASGLSGTTNANAAESAGTGLTNTPAGPTGPANPPAPAPTPRTYATDALLFNGNGVWAAEVTSLESIMDQHHMTYREVTSSELDAMTVDQLANFGMIVWPGGSGGTQAGSLSPQTHANLREAVQQRGVSYIGFCAGSFVAVAPAPAPGQDVSYGLGIVAGPELQNYYLDAQGVEIAMTMGTFADGSKHDLVWYGGPITPNIPGGVVAKYPDGNPMISEMWSGRGWVILSGPHPAAPQAIRDDFGLNDSDGLDLDLAYTLLQDALHQQALKAF